MAFARPPTLPMPALDDPEGAWTPRAGTFDAHVHFFPDKVFGAIWQWFETHGWPIRYKLRSEEIVEFLATRGVTRMAGLHYAHKPGIAQSLNAYLLDLARRHREVVPFATVYPGEPNAREIVRRAIGEGARGVKLHCHVQKLAPDDARILEVAEELQALGAPLVIHSGKEPSSDAYGFDCRGQCDVSAALRILERCPGLTLVVAHMGADEYAEYDALLDRYPNLYLDTAMVVADFFPGANPAPLVARHPTRILYGSDFPNLPYAWDRELAKLEALLSPDDYRLVTGGNAERLYGPR